MAFLDLKKKLQVKMTVNAVNLTSETWLLYEILEVYWD